MLESPGVRDSPPTFIDLPWHLSGTNIIGVLHPTGHSCLPDPQNSSRNSNYHTLISSGQPRPRRFPYHHCAIVAVWPWLQSLRFQFWETSVEVPNFVSPRAKRNLLDQIRVTNPNAMPADYITK